MQADEPTYRELPQDEASLRTFLDSFEDGTLPKECWTHAAHIFTGACYVHSFGETAAIDRMRAKVSAYNVAVGGQNTPNSGYHETVTVLWIKLIAQFHAQHLNLSRIPFAARAVEHFEPQRNLLSRYYDYDVVASIDARRTWHPPTLMPQL